MFCSWKLALSNSVIKFVAFVVISMEMNRWHNFWNTYRKEKKKEKKKKKSALNYQNPF